jgi:hypothetical protein
MILIIFHIQIAAFKGEIAIFRHFQIKSFPIFPLEVAGCGPLMRILDTNWSGLAATLSQLTEPGGIGFLRSSFSGKYCDIGSTSQQNLWSRDYFGFP